MKQKLTSLWQRLFGDSVRAFGVVSVVFLFSIAIAPAKNHFSEWRHYQQGYLKMIRNRSDANTLQRHFQGGIDRIRSFLTNSINSDAPSVIADRAPQPR
jgi:hypothetical protein